MAVHIWQMATTGVDLNAVNNDCEPCIGVPMELFEQVCLVVLDIQWLNKAFCFTAAANRLAETDAYHVEATISSCACLHSY